MSRRRGNLFAGSYNEELREALAANPNFVQAPNLRGSYVSTRAEEAASAVPDASDPPYTPTARAERADIEGVDSLVPARRSPRRSKRLRPFYVDWEVEPASGNRRTRETDDLLTSRTTVRERLLVTELPSSSLGSEGTARNRVERKGSGRSARSASSEFTDDNFPPTNASGPRTCNIQNLQHSPQPAAYCAPVCTPTMLRTHRRKQNRPYRCPVM